MPDHVDGSLLKSASVASKVTSVLDRISTVRVTTGGCRASLVALWVSGLVWAFGQQLGMWLELPA
eukprot:1146532-Pelagomonas_calceolata.AAC.2